MRSRQRIHGIQDTAPSLELRIRNSGEAPATVNIDRTGRKNERDNSKNKTRHGSTGERVTPLNISVHVSSEYGRQRQTKTWNTEPNKGHSSSIWWLQNQVSQCNLKGSKTIAITFCIIDTEGPTIMGLYTVTKLNLTKFNLIYSSLHPREVNRNLENNQTTLHQPESRKVLLRNNGLSISVQYKLLILITTCYTFVLSSTIRKKCHPILSIPQTETPLR